ncbi:protein IWS1 homolog A-like [Pectinophora gossypiella]|uniref:protein IWS1 homolog A-like n=1 Tax=Pectinophora gossypiella TaxID=13191 RepID=UPI00214ECC2F|nr:protein IWS1 homolog A-like [Pectinophora gossypiella]
MPANTVKIDKKKSLLAHKEKLLEELKYYEARITEEKNNVNKNSFEVDASSDSDTEFAAMPDSIPPMGQLKRQEITLQTCLQATQELAGIDVLQAEVNVVVNEPDLQGESPISEAGVWREVTAECCVDLVPFSITFYAHRADRKFAPIRYRCLRVSPLKTAHEAELANSVLPGLRKPSDAVEVLRSYAVAYRSRRSTLARLADKFGTSLFMEPLAEGGYLLKCANLLEVSWTLQNKWSPIAPFHHRMKFDLEYMNESYIKELTSLHRQLSEPSIDTSERTQLLSRMLAACLRAADDTDDVTPGVDADVTDDDVMGAAKVAGRRTTLDREPDMPDVRHNKDSQVMAPPKSLPKKSRPKTKDATSDSRKSDLKPAKRSIQEDSSNRNIKKPKVIEKTEDNLSDMVEKYEKSSKSLKNKDDNVANTKNKDDNSVASAKNVAKTKNKENKSDANNKNKEGKTKSQDITANVANSKSKEVKSDTGAASNVASGKNDVNVNKGDKNTNTKNEKSKVANAKSKDGKNTVVDNENVASGKDKGEKNNAKNDGNNKVDAAKKKDGKIAKAKNADDIADDTNTVDKPVKNISKNVEKPEKSNKESKKSNTASMKKIDSADSVKTIEKTKKTEGHNKDSAKNSIKDKKLPANSVSLKRKSVANVKNNAATDNNDKATDSAAKKANTTITVNKDSNTEVDKLSSTKVIKTIKEIRNENGEVIKKVVKKLANKTDGSKLVIAKTSVANEKNKEKTDKVANEKNQANKKLDKLKNPLTEHPKNKVSKSNLNKESKIVKPKISTVSTISSKSGNINKIPNSSIEKENVNKNTKIPQKKMFSSPKGVIKKAPIRVSPRKPLMKPKSPLVGKKVIQKPVTGIPRLVAKPKPKIN